MKKFLVLLFVALGLLYPVEIERAISPVVPVATVEAAHTEFYITGGGSKLNSGSTTANTAAQTYTSGNWDGTVFTVASGDPVADGVAVGDWASVYVDGASVSTYRGRITARTTTTITVSTTAKHGTAPGNGTGNRSLKVGGAAFVGGTDDPWDFFSGTMVDASGNPTRINIKDDVTYQFTAAPAAASVAGPCVWEGYHTTAGDGSTNYFAKFDGTTGSVANTPINLLTVSGANQTFRNLHFDRNYPGSPTPGDASANFMVDISAANTIFENIKLTRAWRFGLQQGGSGSWFQNIIAVHNNDDDASDMGGIRVTEESVWFNSYSISNGTQVAGTDGVGWDIATASGEPTFFFACRAIKNPKHGFQVRGSSSSAAFDGAVAWGNNDNGIYTTGTAGSFLMVQNSILGLNGISGIHRNAAGDGAVFIRKNFFYSNTSAQVNANINTSFVSGSVTLTGDPFEDSANGDFDLNNTAGAGAAVRAAAYAVFINPGYTKETGSFRDGGGAQHLDSGGGGTTIINGSYIFSQ